MHELSKQALVSSGLMNQLRKNGEPQPANKYVLPRPCLFVSAIWLSLKITYEIMVLHTRLILDCRHICGTEPCMRTQSALRCP